MILIDGYQRLLENRQYKYLYQDSIIELLTFGTANKRSNNIVDMYAD